MKEKGNGMFNGEGTERAHGKKRRMSISLVDDF
jgi:hypothetical protein